MTDSPIIVFNPHETDAYKTSWLPLDERFDKVIAQLKIPQAYLCLLRYQNTCYFGTFSRKQTSKSGRTRYYFINMHGGQERVANWWLPVQAILTPNELHTLPNYIAHVYRGSLGWGSPTPNIEDIEKEVPKERRAENAPSEEEVQNIPPLYEEPLPEDANPSNIFELRKSLQPKSAPNDENDDGVVS